MLETYRQTRLLFEALDEMLEGAGLYPSRGTLGDNLRASVGRDPGTWLPLELHLLYTEGEDGNVPQDRYVTVDICFPTDGAAHPVIAISTVSLASPVQPKEFWDSSEGFARVIAAQGLDGMARAIPSEELRPLRLKDATRARGFALPLCQLDEHNLELLLVRPALELHRAPGDGPPVR